LIVGVEVDVGDGEHALRLNRKRQAEQGISMEVKPDGSVSSHFFT
jgi:hypothetical protein